MNSPYRILHVFGGMNRGGAETFAMNVYRNIDRTRVQFDFAVQTDRPSDYDSEIESMGGRILRHPVPAQAGLHAYQRAFGATLQQHGPFAAVHSHVHLFSGLVLKLSKHTHVPLRISHSHSNGTTARLSPQRRAYAFYMRHLIQKCATHLLGCSQRACEALYGSTCWNDRRVQVVPNAIELREYAGAHTGDRLREELGMPHGSRMIAHVGSFSEPKNHRFLLQIFDSLRRQSPDVHLLLVGDGALRTQIESQIRGAGLEGAVHLLGVRNDVPRILKAVDLLLLPSLWEGLPMVLVEAQAAGVPCLVSDAVTPEADLNTGLIHFASLLDSHDDWAAECVAHFRNVGRSAQDRESALKAAGYDVKAVATRLSGIYMNWGALCTS